MARTLLLLTAAFLLSGGLASAAVKPKAKPAASGKAGAFEAMDTDKNGKVTKEEFRKWSESLAAKAKKGKANTKVDAAADAVFAKIDTNNDGVITKEEFEKHEAGGAAKAKKAKKAK